MITDNPIIFPSSEFDQTGHKLIPREDLTGVLELGGYAFAFVTAGATALEQAIVSGRPIADKYGNFLVRVSPIDGHVIESSLDSDRLTTLQG